MVKQVHDTPPRPNHNGFGYAPPRPQTVEHAPNKKPTPPHGIRYVRDGLGVVCQRCGAEWGECEHSCNYVSTKVDNDGTWFILGLAVGMVVTSVFFNLL